VSWHKQTGKWQVKLTWDGKEKHLGSFDNDGKAARAHIAEARKHFTEATLPRNTHGAQGFNFSEEDEEDEEEVEEEDEEEDVAKKATDSQQAPIPPGPILLLRITLADQPRTNTCPRVRVGEAAAGVGQAAALLRLR